MNIIESELLEFSKAFISVSDAIELMLVQLNVSRNDAAKWLILKNIDTTDDGITEYFFNEDDVRLNPVVDFCDTYQTIRLILLAYAKRGGIFGYDNDLQVYDDRVRGWLRDDFHAFMKKHIPTWIDQKNTHTKKQERPTKKYDADDINIIFDTAHHDHSPDLAEAVKLWMHMYGGEKPTPHSHSNGADIYLRTYSAGSTSKGRIKEVCSPKRIWKHSRLLARTPTDD